MIVSPKSASVAAPPTAGHAEAIQVPHPPTQGEAAAALLLIRKAVITDPSVARSLDLAA